MRHKTRKLGGVRLAEREIEAASRRVQMTDKSFLYPVRRVWFASDVGFDRGIEKTGVLVQNDIHEARKLGSVRLAEREVEATSRRVPRTDKSFLYPVRRIWFASGVGFDRRIEKTGFWCKMNIHTLMNNIHDLTHLYVMNSVSILEKISRILGHADRFRVIFEK